jgi:hypothetical protein
MRMVLEHNNDVTEIGHADGAEPPRREYPVVELQGGIPVWVHGPDAVVITNKMVRRLADAE